MVRDEESVFRTFLHELQSFGPSLYHSVERECGRFAALYGAVEERSVHEHALIVALHLVGGFRSASVAFLYHLILQSAGQCHHAFLLGVLGKICLAFFLCLLELLGCRGALLSLLLLEEILYERLRFGIVYFRLLACENVLYCFCEIVDVQIVRAHLR